MSTPGEQRGDLAVYRRKALLVKGLKGVLRVGVRGNDIPNRRTPIHIIYHFEQVIGFRYIYHDFTISTATPVGSSWSSPGYLVTLVSV